MAKKIAFGDGFLTVTGLLLCLFLTHSRLVIEEDYGARNYLAQKDAPMG